MSAPANKYILSIDLGTSGPKVGLYSSRGEHIAHEFEPTPLYLFPNGGAEQKPDEWWRAITTAAKRLLAGRSVPPDQVAAVCCTSQWSGTVAVDRDGNALANAIIWMDSRGARYIDRITDGAVKIERYDVGKLIQWIRLTGGAPSHSGKDPLAHILYLKHECPEIYDAAYKFLEPKDYVNLRLTGKFAASYDSILVHWVTDNRKLSSVVYDKRLLDMANLDREKLPDLKRAVDILGTLKPEVAAELGLDENVQVVMGTPDIHSAAIGSGAVANFQGHVYVGTSSWLCCHVPFKKTDLFHNIASAPCAVPDRYLLIATQESAGICLSYLRDNIFYHQDALPTAPKPENSFELFDRIAEGAPAGSGGVIFAPWLYGERAPVEDYHVRGGFFNQSLRTTREHLIRAVFEGVALNSRWLLSPVEKFAGRQFDTLNMIGGGANSAIWCQIYADVLNRTIRQVRDPMLANLRGAALLGSAALGYLSFDDIPALTEISHTFQPNPVNTRLYDDLFKEFVNIYSNNKKIFARMNRHA